MRKICLLALMLSPVALHTANACSDGSCYYSRDDPRSGATCFITMTSYSGVKSCWYDLYVTCNDNYEEQIMGVEFNGTMPSQCEGQMSP